MARYKKLKFEPSKLTARSWRLFFNLLQVDLLIETEEYKDMMYVCELLYNMNKFHLLLTHPDADKVPHTERHSLWQYGLCLTQWITPHFVLNSLFTSQEPLYIIPTPEIQSQ